MTAQRRAVRHRLTPGRLLPLGGAREGAWISEEAAGAVLSRAAGKTRGVRLDVLRIGLADPEDVGDPAVRPPPGALPPGPLRVTAEFAVTAAVPLPATAALVRTALAAAAGERLGLRVAEVDLRVTALLDEEPDAVPVRRPGPPHAAEPGPGDEGRVAAAALSVPGVTHLTAGLGRAVHLEERQEENALPRRHARVELAVDADHRASDVARRVRAAVHAALPDHPTVAVVVTAAG